MLTKPMTIKTVRNFRVHFNIAPFISQFFDLNPLKDDDATLEECGRTERQTGYLFISELRNCGSCHQRHIDPADIPEGLSKILEL